MMTDIEQLITWVVLSPIALFTCITCIVIIAHYQPYYHGTDIALFSIFLALTIRVATVILIQAILGLSNLGWSHYLCNFYVWIYVTLQVAELLSFVVASVHWMIIPRSSTKKKIYISTKYVKIGISLTWFFAIVIGLVPVIEWSPHFQDEQCRFLPYNLGTSFSIFFIIMNIFAFSIALICTLDTMVLFRSMKRVAKNKYQAGRFYLPSSASVAKTASQTVHAKYNELNFSSDLCRLVVILILFSFCVHHIPFTIMEFYQLVDYPDRNTLETIILWLILIQAIVLPHFLWFLSKRYRHALDYTWKVHILRDLTAQEEDPSACTLQSYTRKIRDVDGKTVRVTTIQKGRSTILPNGHMNGDTSKMNGYNIPNGQSPRRQNGMTTSVVVTDIDDGMAVATNNHSPNGSKEASITNGNSPSDTNPASPTKSTLSTPSHMDLERTASSSSRKEWKEQMRRKHLPAVFVNEAFDADVTDASKENNTIEKNDSHFYMSSDFHPDNLTNSLPRSTKPQESESEGVSNQYDDDDIDHILDLDKDKSSVSEQCLILDLSDDRSSCDSNPDEQYYTNKNKSGDIVDLDKIIIEDVKPSKTLSENGSANLKSLDDASSSASEKSVTIEPYPLAKRPLWMDSSEEDVTSFQALEPVAYENSVFTDPFDNDIDRGFEEALAAGYASSLAGYSSMGLCFESIKEEPEEMSETGGTHDEMYSPFKTQAISSGNTRPPSQASSENPFDNVPVALPPSTTDSFDQDARDSGFPTTLTNGVSEPFSTFKPPSTSHEISSQARDRHSIGSSFSQGSATSQEVANISKAALMKQKTINGDVDAKMTAYF